VLLDRLAPEQQAAVRASWQADELYGILQPKRPERAPIKAVGHSTALLFLTLRSPGPVPRYVVERGDDAAAETVADLILEGVLQIRRNGRFVSGAAALELLDGAPHRDGGGALAQLSLQALRYVDALGIDDVAELTARLYHYHRIPMGPEWVRRLPDASAVSRWLGLYAGSRLHDLLTRHWHGPVHDSPDSAWSFWSRASGWRARGDARAYKLYVSPTPADFPRTLDTVARVLSESRARAFKHSAAPVDCLRPDKLVAYFSAMEDLMDTSTRLARELEGVRAHGVPFTAELGLDGVLSWAVDPDRQSGRTSWRVWVASRLATFLVAAGPARGKVDRSAYALNRLRSLGVDTDRWLPRSFLFTTGEA
jgi:hypothetical protein